MDHGAGCRPSRAVAGVIDIARRAHQLRFGCHDVVYARLAAEHPEAARLALQLDFQGERVTRYDRPLEAGAIDADEVIDEPPVRLVRHGPEREDRGGLSERLYDHHPGHDGMVRKVPDEEMLVDGDVLQRDDALAGFAFEHAIDQ